LAQLLQCRKGESYRLQEKERTLRSNNQLAETATAVVVPLDRVKQVVTLLPCNEVSSIHSKQATGEIYQHSNKHQSMGRDSSSSDIGNRAASGDSECNSKKGTTINQ